MAPSQYLRSGLIHRSLNVHFLRRMNTLATQNVVCQPRAAASCGPFEKCPSQNHDLYFNKIPRRFLHIDKFEKCWFTYFLNMGTFWTQGFPVHKLFLHFSLAVNTIITAPMRLHLGVPKKHPALCT